MQEISNTIDICVICLNEIHNYDNWYCNTCKKNIAHKNCIVHWFNEKKKKYMPSL